MATVMSGTVEDMLALPMGSGRYDLIEGEMYRMAPAGGQHGGIAGTLSRVVGNFVFDRDLGTVYTAETGFILRRDPDSVLVPDLAFVAAERLPPLDDQVGFLALAPDLAIEIVSPSETTRRVAAKVAASSGSSSPGSGPSRRGRPIGSLASSGPTRPWTVAMSCEGSPFRWPMCSRRPGHGAGPVEWDRATVTRLPRPRHAAWNEEITR